VTAVDVLNEGIDVPDVNVLVFLRSTHSRRIFVQQLGRGLRIKEGKERVIALDFVADIRRVAALLEMDKEARQPQQGIQKVYIPGGFVRFNDQKAETFFREFLADLVAVADDQEDQLLRFP
jgi:superfamily II DNA or RNA helicase